MTEKTKNRLLILMWIIGVAATVLIGTLCKVEGIWIPIGSVWFASIIMSGIFCSLDSYRYCPRIKEKHEKWVGGLILCPTFNVFLMIWLAIKTN